MQEKRIKIKGKHYKELYYQIFNLLILIAFLFEEINHHIPVWAIVPVVLAIIVLATLVQITYLSIKEESKKIGKPILRCYRWDDYVEGTSNHRIYSDRYVYVEIVCDEVTYKKFIQVYNTKEKLKKLVYKEFHTYITIE